MNCPHCGAAEQSAGAYCRRCGEWLSGRRSHGSGSPEERMTVMIVFSAISAVFALVSAIVLFATYLGRPEAKWSIYLASAMCLVIAVHQAISFGFALGLKVRRNRGREEGMPGRVFESPAPAGELPGMNTGEVIDMPSVTEATTEFLPGRRDTKRGLNAESAGSPGTPST
jgi:hypothetical protein